MPRYLYAGDLSQGQLAGVRCLALRSAGADVVPFDFSPFYAAVRASLVRRAILRLRGEMAMDAMNEALARACADSSADVLYVDKGTYVTRETLLRIRREASARGSRIVLLHFHPDDAFHPKLYTKTYGAALGEYDCHLSPHRWVLDQHLARGARRVAFLPYGYDPASHFREGSSGADDASDRCDVVFVGRWESARGRWLSGLGRLGVRVDVWGPGWSGEASRGRPGLVHRAAHASFAQQRHAYSSARISLGLLSSTNHDGHTSRTFEVPACGGFMLGERTSGQLEFFREGGEIACFASFDELAARVRYYVDHPAEREEIREAGYTRCTTSGYDYASRMTRVIEEAEHLLRAE